MLTKKLSTGLARVMLARFLFRIFFILPSVTFRRRLPRC